MEKQKLRVKAIKQLLSPSDIEELYAEDKPTFEQLQSIAETQIPPEVDDAVSTFLAELDIEIAGVDPMIKPAIRVIFHASKWKGWDLKQHVLETKVQTWIINAPTASLALKTPTPSIYHASCPECDEKFDEKRYICPNCYTLIVER